MTTDLAAILLPTVLNVPPPIAALENDADYLRFNGISLGNTFIGNFLDACAISIPMNAPSEAPVGLMLMNVWGCDAGLFSTVEAVERIIQ